MKKITFLISCAINFLYIDVSTSENATLCLEELPSSCPTILTRNDWKGDPPTEVQYTVFPIDYVIIHHTVTDPCTTTAECANIVQSIQNHHTSDALDFGDIGYSFLVGGDGNVYEGRGWHKVGAHTYGYNKRSIGIALIGNFEKNLPVGRQIQATKDLLKCGVELNELSEDYILYGAKQVGSTASPGAKLYTKIRTWPHYSSTVQ